MDVEYVAIKRDNMMKSEEEKPYYQLLSRVKGIIEMRFSQLEGFRARLIRAVSRRGLAVKITLSISSLNIYQMIRGA
jgi:hypothetical protein